MIIFILFYVSWLVFLILSILLLPSFIPGISLGLDVTYSLPIAWGLSLLVLVVFYLMTDREKKKDKKKE